MVGDLYALSLSDILYSFFDTKAVVLALGITAIVCVVVTIFSFQTKVRPVVSEPTGCDGLTSYECDFVPHVI